MHFIDHETIATGGEDYRLRIWRPLRLCHEAAHENFVTDFHAYDRSSGVSCSYDGKITPHTWHVPS